MQIRTCFRFCACDVYLRNGSDFDKLTMKRKWIEYNWRWQNQVYRTDRGLRWLLLNEEKQCEQTFEKGFSLTDGLIFTRRNGDLLTWRGTAFNQVAIELINDSGRVRVACGFIRLENRFVLRSSFSELLPELLFMNTVVAMMSS